MRFTAQDIVALHDKLEGDMKQWHATWDDVAYLMQPSKVGFIARHAEGEIKTYDLRDSIGMEVLDDLANYLQSVLTPQAMQWFKLGFKNTEVDQDDAARQWIERCEELMYAEMEDSNFYSSVAEFYKDIASFGTAAFMCEERKGWDGKSYNGLSYRSIHLREIYGLTNQYGEVDCTIRVHTGIPREWINRFGAAAGQEIHRDATQDPGREYTFLHAVFPRDYEQIDLDAFQLKKVEGKRLPYASMWVNKTEGTLVKESGYYEPPRVIARWDDNTDQGYAGHGPGLRAMPDIGTINEAAEMEMTAWEKSIDPPTKETQNNVVGSVHIQPGGRTVVKRMDEFQPVFNHTKWDLTFIKREDLEAAVRNIMYTDLIREPEDLKSGTTAYEVSKRMERAQRILGEAVGRIKAEWLRWVVMRTFSIMYLAGRFDQEPPEVLDGELDVRYISPLMIAQQSQGLENMRMFIADMAGVAALQSPEAPGEAPIMDNVHWDGYAEEAARRYAVPARVIRDEDERKRLREQREQDKRDAATLGAAGQLSEVVRNVGGGAGQEAAEAVLTNLRGAGG